MRQCSDPHLTPRFCRNSPYPRSCGSNERCVRWMAACVYRKTLTSLTTKCEARGCSKAPIVHCLLCRQACFVEIEDASSNSQRFGAMRGAHDGNTCIFIRLLVGLSTLEQRAQRQSDGQRVTAVTTKTCWRRQLRYATLSLPISCLNRRHCQYYQSCRRMVLKMRPQNQTVRQCHRNLNRRAPQSKRA